MSHQPQPCLILATALRPCSAEDLPGKSVVRLPNGAVELLANDQFTPVASMGVHAEVIMERLRQITMEGWSPSHDDKYDKGDLAAAAAAYAFHAFTVSAGDRWLAADPVGFWPWDLSWWKPGAARQDLVKAGALILAEIERLDRAEAAETKAAA